MTVDGALLAVPSFTKSVTTWSLATSFLNVGPEVVVLDIDAMLPVGFDVMVQR